MSVPARAHLDKRTCDGVKWNLGLSKESHAIKCFASARAAGVGKLRGAGADSREIGNARNTLPIRIGQAGRPFQPIRLSGYGVKLHDNVLAVEDDTDFSQDRSQQNGVGSSADLANGGNLSGVIDGPPRHAAPILDQSDVAEAGTGEDQSVDITHDPVLVNECVIDAVIIGGGVGIADNFAEIVDRIGVTTDPAQRSEVNIVASSAAKKHGMENGISQTARKERTMTSATGSDET